MPRIRLLLPLLVLFALLGHATAATQATGEPALFSADGYRLDRYRSPTPASVDGARTIDTAALQQLLASEPQTLLIDVFRRPWLHGTRTFPAACGWPTSAKARRRACGSTTSPTTCSEPAAATARDPS